jgi:hypothetical protein
MSTKKELRVLTREEALAAADRQGQWVPIPKWGGRFYVAEFGGHERDLFDQAVTLAVLPNADPSKFNMRALVVSLAVVHSPEDLTPVFTAKDVEALGRKSSDSLDLIYNVAVRQSRLDKGAIERLVDALGKVLMTNSGTASRSPSDEPSSRPSEPSQVPSSSPGKPTKSNSGR